MWLHWLCKKKFWLSCQAAKFGNSHSTLACWSSQTTISTFITFSHFLHGVLHFSKCWGNKSLISDYWKVRLIKTNCDKPPAIKTVHLYFYKSITTNAKGSTVVLTFCKHFSSPFTQYNVCNFSILWHSLKLQNDLIYNNLPNNIELAAKASETPKCVHFSFNVTFFDKFYFLGLHPEYNPYRLLNVVNQLTISAKSYVLLMDLWNNTTNSVSLHKCFSFSL